MGRKVYGSGLTAADLAPAGKPKVRKGQSPAVLRQHVSGPDIDDATRVKTALYLHSTGNGDLWEALGLTGMLDRRRAALGLPPLFDKPTTKSFRCDACGARPGAPCHDTNGVAIGSRYHSARSRTYRLECPVEQLAEEFITETGDQQ